jgi:hypothetical protein
MPSGCDPLRGVDDVAPPGTERIDVLAGESWQYSAGPVVSSPT